MIRVFVSSIIAIECWFDVFFTFLFKGYFMTKQSPQAVFHLFRSGKELRAFTNERDGSNLNPINHQPWLYMRDVLLISGKPAPFGLSADTIIEAVRNSGYSLHRIVSKVTFTETVGSPPPSAR